MLNVLDNFNAQAMLSKISTSKARKSLTAILVIASALVFGVIVKVLLSAPPTIASSNSLKASNTPSNLRWNWFPSVRAPVSEAPKQQVTDEELSRATIKAELLGVVITEDVSYAAISTSKNPQGVYSVGDNIENNVSLEEIQDYRVIISQRGSRRQIPLKSLEKGGKRGAKRNSLIEVGTSSSSTGPSSNSSLGFNLSGLVSTKPIQLPNGSIGLKLDGLSEDLTDLADVQEGDVVLAVNGSPVSELLTNPLLWQQFSRQTNMPITIMRGEEQLELFVNAASLSQKILPRIGAGQVK